MSEQANKINKPNTSSQVSVAYRNRQKSASISRTSSAPPPVSNFDVKPRVGYKPGSTQKLDPQQLPLYNGGRFNVNQFANPLEMKKFMDAQMMMRQGQLNNKPNAQQLQLLQQQQRVMHNVQLPPIQKKNEQIQFRNCDFVFKY